jgi:hypothetical protein
MGSSIRLSDKHGVNPSLMVCFYCGDDYGVALLGHCKGDAEAPRRAVFEMTPCPTCEGHMKLGVIFIETLEDDPVNPSRTGRIVVIKEEAVREIIKEPLLTEVLKMRATFVSSSAWKTIGLPQGD